MCSGRTRAERYVGDDGVLRTRRRTLAQPDWEVLITDHHRVTDDRRAAVRHGLAARGAGYQTRQSSGR
jgi:hypothetical protein